MISNEITATFDSMWRDLATVGRHQRTGGYRRFAWTDADTTCREWFAHQAQARGLDLVVDHNGNQWAWWGDPDANGPGVVTGSHLDSVADGGAFDGPLGIASAFAAIDALRAADEHPRVPIGVVNFAEEEGTRFGVSCTGSRLLTGSGDAGRLAALRDDDGVTLAEAMTSAGFDPHHLGRDAAVLARVGTFVELHVEQGKGLVDLGRAVGVASSIWPHGRWRFDFVGRANHAGTTGLADRDDPTLRFAEATLAARELAAQHHAVATFGRLDVHPNSTNAIPARVRAWLDTRAPNEPAVRAVVDELTARTGADVTEESWTPRVDFDDELRDRLADTLDAPVLPTGAGHDAGILATAQVPTAMLFVRNPTGVSHAPDEHAEAADCHTGIDALATALHELAGR